MAIPRCRACGAPETKLFYRVDGVPAHSVMQMRTRQEAIEYPRGDIALAYCAVCGFIQNDAFDSTLQDYSSEYEETQGFSGVFSNFRRSLGQELVERFDLRGKRILEIGCGKGAFLTLLCQLGDNRGLGFDPAFVDDRVEVGADPRVRFVSDLYSRTYSNEEADFVCCQMTLEHVEHPFDLLRALREAAGIRAHTQLFVQVPDVRRILAEKAFWDIYYEHCSYFSAGSLSKLFLRSGFEVTDVWRDYDDQYLMVSGRVASDTGPETLQSKYDPEEVGLAVQRFGVAVAESHNRSRSRLASLAAQGRRVVLWGAGSKAVSFLGTLGLGQEIQYAVDVNPYRQGTFLAGGGQEIIAPSRLAALGPDVVVVMNPVYLEEIRLELSRLGLAPVLVTVNEIGEESTPVLLEALP